MTRSIVAHSFSAGSFVRLVRGVPSRNAAPGPFEIQFLLPPSQGRLEYRIKSAAEPFQRVVNEDDLELVEAG
jgi:hypothetical protein